MYELQRLQKHFQDYLFATTSLIHQDIISTPTLSATTRLAIYRDAFFSRLHKVLLNDFPALHNLLGDKQFLQLTQHYINAYPSQFTSLRWFSSHLAYFLKIHTFFKTQELLVEIARFEWALIEVFDGADFISINFAEMSAIAPERWPVMCFQLQPLLQIQTFLWNTVEIWQCLQNKKDYLINKANSPIHWLLWRQNFTVQFTALGDDEVFVVQAMLQGKNFGDICKGLCEWLAPTAVAIHAASLLKRFIFDGLITKIYFAET